MLKRGLLLALLMWPGLALAQVFIHVPGIRVNVAPPPARIEVRSVQPSPAHVWIGGHWVWRGGAHVWAPGHWGVPPGAGYAWVEPRWVQENGQWVFFEGHWRPSYNPRPGVFYEPPAPPAQPIVVQAAPPAPVVEVRPPTPFGGAVWIPGYWHWSFGRHVWVAGHWSAPRTGFVWESHRWQQTGTGWTFVPGHWRRL